MLSTEQLYTLLAHGFFPKWLSTLRQWLGQAPAFHEARHPATPPLAPACSRLHPLAPACTPLHPLVSPCTPACAPLRSMRPFALRESPHTPNPLLHSRASPHTRPTALDQVSQWYLGWKELLTQRAPQLLQHNGAREQLTNAIASANVGALTQAYRSHRTDFSRPFELTTRAVGVGLHRIVALHYHSPTLYRI